jgi:hypothetical protein
MDDAQGAEGNVRFLRTRYQGGGADQAVGDSDPGGDEGGAQVVPLQGPRDRGEAGEPQAPVVDGVALLHRALTAKYLAVPKAAVVEVEWDSDAGMDFLRTLMAARIAGLDIEAIGKELGVERLQFVLMARERDLL